MPRRSVSDLKPGERLDDQIFLIRSKDLRTTTNGGLYIHVILMDRTGQLVARMWQASEEIFESMSEGGYMRFKGRLENYKGNLQFIIDAVRPAEPGSYDVADFLPTTKHDIEQMFARVMEILGQIKNPWLAALIKEFQGDETLMGRFRKSPAATAMHHAYIGGLVEHTLAVLELALVAIPRYPKLSLDLVLAGVFLHDLGKTAELCYDPCIRYSDEGQLLGHITQAVLWIEKKADAISERTGKPFPDRLRWVLQHIVLSHRGQYGFGSAKLPAVPEAVAVHYLDNFDAKITMFLSEIEGDRDPASNWTNYNRALETKIFKSDVMGTRGGND